jgi:hypothetical protein
VEGAGEDIEVRRTHAPPNTVRNICDAQTTMMTVVVKSMNLPRTN